jgi:hypothetical protein
MNEMHATTPINLLLAAAEALVVDVCYAGSLLTGTGEQHTLCSSCLAVVVLLPAP